MARNGPMGSMSAAAAQAIEAILRIEALEELPDLRMADRLASFVIKQVLLGNIGYVFGFFVFSEEMIKRLILARTDVFRNR